MSLEYLEQEHTERITEWVTGGCYAVAVEVEAIFYPNRLGEPYLTPETVRYLELLEQRAEAGDVEALKQAGTVYVRLGEPAPRTAPSSVPASEEAALPQTTPGP